MWQWQRKWWANSRLAWRWRIAWARTENAMASRWLPKVANSKLMLSIEWSVSAFSTLLLVMSGAIDWPFHTSCLPSGPPARQSSLMFPFNSATQKSIFTNAIIYLRRARDKYTCTHRSTNAPDRMVEWLYTLNRKDEKNNRTHKILVFMDYCNRWQTHLWIDRVESLIHSDQK